MRQWFRERDLFEKCLVVSFAAHLLIFLMVGLVFRPFSHLPPAVEVDLTIPMIGGAPAKLGAPKTLVPGAKGIPLPVESNTPPKVVEQPPPPKDWVMPGPQTKVLDKPAPPPPTPGGTSEGAGTAAKTGGMGLGADEGVPGGIGSGGSGLLQLPRLLNRDELLENLRRFYPESERRVGHEGSVLATLHIGVDGRVDPVEIAHSAGPAFDAAAREVARRMRFSPALSRYGPVAVKMNQAIIFKLQD